MHSAARRMPMGMQAAGGRPQISVFLYAATASHSDFDTAAEGAAAGLSGAVICGAVELMHDSVSAADSRLQRE